MPKLQVSGQKRLTQSCILLSQAFNVAFAKSFESAAGEHGDSWARMNSDFGSTAGWVDKQEQSSIHFVIRYSSFRTYSTYTFLL